MELSKEYLLEHGYETNHPDHVLCRLYKSNNENPEWRVSVEQEYIPLSNKLAFNISCWRCNETGAIVKRAAVSLANTVEELDAVIALCGITK